jgi:Tfp pilus assembly protein PilZ
MTTLDSQFGQYHVTARLFNLLNNLSRDKQFILYKQLIKDNIITELLKLIIDMSEEQKIQLLEQLGEMPYEEAPIQTVNLDENESFMRENPRKICLIPVVCKVESRSFKSYIIDISTVGAFIETNDRYPVGQKIVMAFKIPKHPDGFELNGKISRSGPKGVGIKFVNLTKAQQGIIESYIKSKQ